MDLQTWPEKLDEMKLKDRIELDAETSVQTIYSAARSPKFFRSTKKFAVRTDPASEKKYVIRIK